ncbi:hypothetical protein PCK1_000021 [Pneumocystis canis]|nr:hypothetical protein PCK1_000021 [Pneumocystis canis]
MGIITSQGAIAPARAGADIKFDVIFSRNNISKYDKLVKKFNIARRICVFFPHTNIPLPLKKSTYCCDPTLSILTIKIDLYSLNKSYNLLNEP